MYGMGLRIALQPRSGKWDLRWDEVLYFIIGVIAISIYYVKLLRWHYRHH